jgi:hypothetical protein
LEDIKEVMGAGLRKLEVLAEMQAVTRKEPGRLEAPAVMEKVVGAE